ncbi:ABC transporter ATP-binding protein [Nocardiopsis gilva]|uniref:ABC transporter ATP-binding protein n=1 Tax=Nocardiopsis gilva TaxID=280236 RepID=UPI0012FE08CE|nr:ABC transporter ATP-binding protein [Nocardiopsis gilva]
MTLTTSARSAGPAIAPEKEPPEKAVLEKWALTRLLRTYLRPSLGAIGIVMLLQLVQTGAMLYLPTLNADIIDNGVARGDTGYIVGSGTVMLAVALLELLCAVGVVYFGSLVAMTLGRDLRTAFFHRVQDLSAREVGHFGAPSLITRTTNDVEQVQMLALMTLTMVASAPIIGVGGIVMAVRQDAELSLVLLVALPTLITAVILLIRRMGPLSASLQQRIDRVNRVVREQITGIRVIRAFTRDAHEQARFGAANDDLLDVGLRLGRIQSFMMPTVMIVIEFANIAVLWFGGHRIDDGGMQVGSLIAFLLYLLQILSAVMMATMAFFMAPRAKVSAGRIQEVLGTSSSVAPPADPVRALPGAGEVEIRDVDFGYPGAEDPVLHGVSLVARSGETTAIIGSTGSGKTTLLNLVPRLVDPTGGTLFVDGVDVRELDPQTLSAVVGLVPQKPYLFTGTVASNLRYGKPDATDEELWRALEIAQARDFVEDMPEKLDAPIGQGGTNVSGGQRQRLAIARALVARPRVFLFDDSFSALDYATDAALRARLERETDGATVIIVAQRVSTIRHAHRIVVLDAGRVVGTGTHEELMGGPDGTGGNRIYREIVLSQLTEEEACQ